MRAWRPGAPRAALLAAAAALLLALPAGAEETRWALLVGIDDYLDPAINDLTGSVNDVEAIYEALVTAARFPSHQVFLLRSNDPGNEPSHSNILAKLRYIADRADSDDLVFVHFSLHAVFDEATERAYLLTRRTDPNDIPRFALALDEVTDLLAGLAAPKRLVVLDGCRNSPERGRGDAPNLLDERFSRGLVITPRQPPAGDVAFTQVIYACGPGQRAYEWPGRNRGLFSVALEEGLRGVGEGTTGDGRVTLGELSGYLRTRVPELLAQNLPGKSQTPDVPEPPAAARDYALSEAQRAAAPVRAIDLPAVPRRSTSPVAELEPVFARQADKLPTVALTAAPSAPLTRAQARVLTLRWLADVDRGVRSYRWRLDDGEVVETGRSFADVIAAEPGTHTFQVQVQDHWGNWSAPAKAEFEVLANSRPEVSIISPAPDAAVEGQRLRVELGGGDADGEIVRWRLALDDPDRFEESDEPTFDLPGPADGPHTLFAQAVDDEGGTSLWQSRSVRFAFASAEQPRAAGQRTTAGGGPAATRTGPGARGWTKGEPAPRIEGLSLAGENAAGLPVYEQTLPGGVLLRLVLIPAGSFLMGSPGSETGRQADEGPQRTQTIDAFLLAETEATQRQWQAVMGTNPSRFTEVGPDGPVETVSWEDIQEFEARTGLCLPTEAQWEYAARAGTTGARHGELEQIAWHYGNSGQQTHPVGARQANDFGLFDTIGNVWEWCEEPYAPSYGTAGVGRPSDQRVFRGGSWGSDARSCRAAIRRRVVPDYRFGYLGFRPCRSLP